MLRARWCIAVAFAVLGSLAASSASARIEVVSWSHVLPCEVDGFALHYGSSPDALDTVIDVGLPHQAGSHFSYELDVPAGQDVFVCVSAVMGELESPCSNRVTIEAAALDESIDEPAPQASQRTWCEDFGAGSRDADWRDTAPLSSLQEALGQFDVTPLGGDAALSTSEPADGIHSHFEGADLLGRPSDSWSDYEYSGEMMFSEPGGGVGVTLYSRYPQAQSYYRFARQPLTASFRLERDVADGRYNKCVAGGPAIYVVPGAWYEFRVRAVPAGDDGQATLIKAKVWPSSQAEPSAFQWACTDNRPTRQVAGTIGVWAAGSGTKGWDNLNVASVPAASELDPIGMPGKPELVP